MTKEVASTEEVAMSGATDGDEVDAFLAAVPEPERATLQAVRAQVQALVPDADEGIAYGLPAFRLHGHGLVGFGPRKGGCSFYPMSPSVLDRFAHRVDGFARTKGSIHFTAQHPLPEDVVRDIVLTRAQECRARG